jgi:maltokinase
MPGLVFAGGGRCGLLVSFAIPGQLAAHPSDLCDRGKAILSTPTKWVKAMTFEQTLARWLAAQRWYPGRGEPPGELTVLADTMLVAGDPALQHLIVDIPAGRDQARYQILVGLRTDLPDSLQHALIGPAGGGLTAYDALHDPALCGLLLDAIAAEKPMGPVRFAREPGATIGSLRGSRVIGSEQSNTSVVFGEAAILKVFRRIFPGINPDLEVPAALARLGSRQIARPYGWIETDLDGGVAQLGVLSEYLAHAVNGRILVLEHLRNLLGPQGNYRRSYVSAAVADASAESISEPDAHGDFADEALALGRATGELHTDLVTAFGSAPMSDEELAALSAAMISNLDVAIAEAPELEPYAPKLRAAYADLTTTSRPVTVQRIHGDYHLAQTLRANEGWVALDFEGEPSVPLALRSMPAPALRDVAQMLRSFDYEARLALLGHPEAARLRSLGNGWAERCQDAFCSGYVEAGGVDPKAHEPLLRALMLEKAVFEVVYNVFHRPAWLAIPLDAIAAA